MSSHGKSDGPLIFSNMAVNEYPVAFQDLVMPELIGEGPMSPVVFRDHEKPGSVLVEAVDDARSEDPSNPGKIRAMVEECVDQGAAGMSGGWVNDHSRGFFDHQEIPVLIKHLERIFFGGQGTLPGRFEEKNNPVAGPKAIPCFFPPPVDDDLFLIEPAGNLRPGHPGHMPGQEDIETLLFFRCARDEFNPVSGGGLLILHFFPMQSLSAPLQCK